MNTKPQRANFLKFLLLSILGIALFLIPIPNGETFTIPVGILIDKVKAAIYDYTLIPLLILVVINAVMTLISTFFKPKFVMENKWFRELFITSPLYIVSRVLGAIIITLYTFKIGPEVIISPSTGGTMIDLARSLICVLLVISYTMPFLTEFGIMEFVGVLISKYLRPLFLVPGRGAIDLITSWLGASNAAVMLTKQQYDKGFYTGKEAGIIMTNFSLVSIPFCYIVADMIGLANHFTSFYLVILVTGIILGIIIPRIYPLKSLSQEYNPKVGKKVNELVPEGLSKLQFAQQEAAKRASETSAKDCLSQGTDMFMSVIFGLSPIIIAWGTIALLMVEYTPIFDILSYPMGLYMNLLGIEGAFDVAPATLVGFADMFIPPLLLAPVKMIETRFIVGAATLLQLIYMTETGAIIVSSDVPMGFKDIVLIFIERTILALAIVTLITKVFVTL